MSENYRLLASDEPFPVIVYNASGKSDYFITCEHAGNLVPRRLNNLGLGPEDLQRHIAWDIGILEVSKTLARELDAPLVAQAYSRLVVDSNRQPGRDDCMTPISDNTEIPGNQAIPTAQAEARISEIFWPYQDEIARRLEARESTGIDTLLISMHSFTPDFDRQTRPWHLGLLYLRDARLANVLKPILAMEADLCVGDNEPYAVGADCDYAIPIHGESSGNPCIEIELRQDLIADASTQISWGCRLGTWFKQAQFDLLENPNELTQTNSRKN